MTYTEIKKIKGKKYYYRVLSQRNGKKVSKKRLYLGKNLTKKEIEKKEIEADKELKKEKREKADKELQKLKAKIKKVLEKYKIKKAGIFGSYARGEQKKKSDIDILIEPPKGIGFGFVGIQFDLEDYLNKKVDLVSYNGLSPYLRDKILDEEVQII